MENPYRVLGVAETASDEQIKEVYRELSKKYHPDLRGDDVSKEEAEAKMAEINAAYDEIMRSRRAGASGSSYGYSQFADIRRLINEKRIAQAEELLNGTPQNNRNAEWHFLKASVLYSRGWFNDAYNHFETAARMDPTNREYAAAFNSMQQRRNGNYNPGGYRTTQGGNGCGCDVCSSLICADCCCECMGGDLIPCC
ncbi:MAG: J domain-containing protein [Ruminococcaceae bacterium]|nr:J domain-containing protein [Oscillospiraceae bacterium]